MNVLYEDNHIIIINKAAGEIVQGDKTGDKSLCDKMKGNCIMEFKKMKQHMTDHFNTLTVLGNLF